MPQLRPWLFRIAHNRALDLLRSRAVRMAEPIEAASDVADAAQPDPLEMLMRQEAVKTAVSRFAELPTLQRSVVILKDVLDESLIEIAALLDLTVDAVKGHLARGRAHLREINAHGRPVPDARPASAAVARYVALFNQRDWDGLRALLADDVKLHQSLHPLRVGAADVGLFFTLYAKIDGVWLAPAWVEGREVIAVFEDRADPKPSYIMWLEWRDGRISFHPRLPLCPLCHRRRRADAGSGSKSGGQRRGPVTCDAEYAAGGEFRLASRQCHVHRAHVRSPQRRRFALGPLLLRPCAASRRPVQARGALNLILASGRGVMARIFICDYDELVRKA